MKRLQKGRSFPLVTIEALEPIRLTEKTGSFRDMEKGDTLELPDDIARRLLKDAKGSVRVVPNRWQWAWREVALLSDGLLPDDPRLPKVQEVIELLDLAYAEDKWGDFWQRFKALRLLMDPERKKA